MKGPLAWLLGLRRTKEEITSNIVEDPGPIDELAYEERPHNVHLQQVLPEKADEIREVDQRSARMYDQIDTHVAQLRKVRAQLVKKKERGELRRQAVNAARTLALYQPAR